MTWDGVLDRSHPVGEDLPFVFSGMLVVQGQGVAQVRATGSHTEMGRRFQPSRPSPGRELHSLVGLCACRAGIVLGASSREHSVQEQHNYPATDSQGHAP
jgi:Ca2+-transporting ATPase